VTVRKGLTRARITDVAVKIVEDGGSEALTLTRLATALGVKPPSLYNHIDGLDSVRRDVAMQALGDLAARLGSAAMGRSGRGALRALADELRRYATAHPGLYELTAPARPDDEEYAAAALRPVEPVLAVLRGYDLDGTEAIHAARALRSALHGFVDLETSGGFGLDVDVDDSFAWLIDRLADSLDATTGSSTQG